MHINWIGKSSELKLHCFCLFDAYSMPKDMCSVGLLFSTIPTALAKQYHGISTYQDAKGQLILKCLFGVIVSTKIATKIL